MKKPQMMIVFLIIVLLAVVSFFMMKKKSPSSMTSDISLAENSAIDSISGTIEDVIAKNIPMECRYTSTVGGQESNGTVMVANNKMKGMFTSSANGQEYTVNMIQDGEYMYSWTEADKKGMKMKLSSLKDQMDKAKDDIVNNQSLTYTQQQGDYSCKPWVALDSTFTPPADVTFTDYSSMMEQSQKMIDKAPADPCSVCDQLPDGEPRDACKTQLKCN